MKRKPCCFVCGARTDLVKIVEDRPPLCRTHAHDGMHNLAVLMFEGGDTDAGTAYHRLCSQLRVEPKPGPWDEVEP